MATFFISVGRPYISHSTPMRFPTYLHRSPGWCRRGCPHKDDVWVEAAPCSLKLQNYAIYEPCFKAVQVVSTSANTFLILGVLDVTLYNTEDNFTQQHPAKATLMIYANRKVLASLTRPSDVARLGHQSTYPGH
jgi:hypothetical protein